MGAEDNLKIGLQKAVSAYEQAAAAMADVMSTSPDPKYGKMVEQLQAHLEVLRGDSAITPPDAT